MQLADPTGTYNERRQCNLEVTLRAGTMEAVISTNLIELEQLLADNEEPILAQLELLAKADDENRVIYRYL